MTKPISWRHYSAFYCLAISRLPRRELSLSPLSGKRATDQQPSFLGRPTLLGHGWELPDFKLSSEVGGAMNSKLPRLSFFF